MLNFGVNALNVSGTGRQSVPVMIYFVIKFLFIFVTSHKLYRNFIDFNKIFYYAFYSFQFYQNYFIFKIITYNMSTMINRKQIPQIKVKYRYKRSK